MLTSRAFLALLVSDITCAYSLMTIFFCLPQYLKEVLKYDIEEVGFCEEIYVY